MNNAFNPDQEVKKITDFIKNTFEQTGKTKAVIALSGGIDSATSFALAHKELGKENLLPLHLPSRHSNPIHTKDVEKLLQSFDFPLENLTTINIAGIIQKSWHIINLSAPQSDTSEANRFLRNRSDLSEAQAHTTNSNDTSKVIAMSDEVKNDARNSQALPPNTPNRRSHNAQITKLNHLRLANLMARTRMMLIYDYAKRHDALVIGTENYSEHLLGYFTRFGDEASDVEPIRHLYKTQVIELAKHLQIPKSIITKAPSADLWTGQSDENEMGFSYADADPILYLNDQGKTPAEIIATGFKEDLVKIILSQVNKNSFKQEVPYKI